MRFFLEASDYKASKKRTLKHLEQSITAMGVNHRAEQGLTMLARSVSPRMIGGKKLDKQRK